MCTTQNAPWFSLYRYCLPLLLLLAVDGLVTVSTKRDAIPVESNANISCNVTADTFTKWRDPNGRTVSTDASSRVHVVSSGTKHDLIITNVKKSDKGEYRCVTTLTSVPVTLYVEYAPSIMLPQSTTTTQWSSYGEPTMVELQCQFDGYPVPSIKLSKDNKPITVGVTKGAGSLTYKFNTKTIEDFGFYGCTAENSQGETTHYMEVAKLGPPEPPANITVKVHCDYVKVDWIPPYDSRGRPVTSYHVELLKDGKVVSGENMGSSKRSHIFLYQLGKLPSYQIRMSCESRVGKGSWDTQPIKTLPTCHSRAPISTQCFLLLVVSYLVAMTTQDCC